MGEYTDLRFKAPLNAWGADIARKMSQAPWPDWDDVLDLQTGLPSSVQKWRTYNRNGFIPRGAGSIAPDNGHWDFTEKGWLTDEDQPGRIETTYAVNEDAVWYVFCSLKNYVGTIEFFLSQVLPYMIREECEASYWNETWAGPRTIRVIPKRWPTSTVSGRMPSTRPNMTNPPKPLGDQHGE